MAHLALELAVYSPFRGYRSVADQSAVGDGGSVGEGRAVGYNHHH